MAFSSLCLKSDTMTQTHLESSIDEIEKNVSTQDIQAVEESKSDVVQEGVQQAEAVVSLISKKTLLIIYFLIWIIFFVESMQTSVTANLTPYVTSAFSAQSLTPTVSVFSSIISACLQLVMAKILDIWGRPIGYLISMIFATIGLIMMAACNTVETYAAAEVFYTFGNNCLQYCLNIFVIDTSSLLNRGFFLALTSSPTMITTWIAGPISQDFLYGAGWRWGFGVFSIIIPIVALPLYIFFIYENSQAKSKGIYINKHGKDWTLQKKILHYLKEFDVIGLLLLSAGLSLFLLPFNIYSYQSEGWKSPLIICLLVFGIVLLFLFAIWEKYTPISFIPFELVTNRTVLGAYLMGATLFVSYYCWFSYFTSFLQVVNDLSPSHALYVANTYNMVSCLWCIIAGWVIHRTGRYKPMALYFGVPLSVFGLGLMIHFRKSDQHVGYLIMCLIFISIGGGIVMICDEIAAMSAASHQYMAVVIAVDSMFSNIGGAIGLAVSAAIWQGIFPSKLEKYLPASELANLDYIYEDLTMQLSYPLGSPTRIAIQKAYGDAQEMMLVAGTAFWAFGFVAVGMWKDKNVKNIQQVKGHVL